MVLGRLKNAESKETVKTLAFSKQQLSDSIRYKNRKDLVNVLLSDNESYSFEEVDCLINQFMRGKVK